MTEYANTPSLIEEWNTQRSRTLDWVLKSSSQRPLPPPSSFVGSRVPSTVSHDTSHLGTGETSDWEKRTLWDGNGWEPPSECESEHSLPPTMVLKYPEGRQVLVSPGTNLIKPRRKLVAKSRERDREKNGQAVTNEIMESQEQYQAQVYSPEHTQHHSFAHSQSQHTRHSQPSSNSLTRAVAAELPPSQSSGSGSGSSGSRGEDSGYGSRSPIASASPVSPPTQDLNTPHWSLIHERNPQSSHSTHASVHSRSQPIVYDGTYPQVPMTGTGTAAAAHPLPPSSNGHSARDAPALSRVSTSHSSSVTRPSGGPEPIIIHPPMSSSLLHTRSHNTSTAHSATYSHSSRTGSGGTTHTQGLGYVYAPSPGSIGGINDTNGIARSPVVYARVPTGTMSGASSHPTQNTHQQSHYAGSTGGALTARDIPLPSASTASASLSYFSDIQARSAPSEHSATPTLHMHRTQPYQSSQISDHPSFLSRTQVRAPSQSRSISGPPERSLSVVQAHPASVIYAPAPQHGTQGAPRVIHSQSHPPSAHTHISSMQRFQSSHSMHSQSQLRSTGHGDEADVFRSGTPGAPGPQGGESVGSATPTPMSPRLGQGGGVYAMVHDTGNATTNGSVTHGLTENLQTRRTRSRSLSASVKDFANNTSSPSINAPVISHIQKHIYPESDHHETQNHDQDVIQNNVQSTANSNKKFVLGPNPPSIVYAPARHSRGTNFSPPRIVYMPGASPRRHTHSNSTATPTATPTGSVRRALTVHGTSTDPTRPMNSEQDSNNFEMLRNANFGSDLNGSGARRIGAINAPGAPYPTPPGSTSSRQTGTAVVISSPNGGGSWGRANVGGLFSRLRVSSMSHSINPNIALATPKGTEKERGRERKVSTRRPGTAPGGDIATVKSGGRHGEQKLHRQHRRAHSADSDASHSSASTYYVIPTPGQKVRIIVSHFL